MGALLPHRAYVLRRPQEDHKQYVYFSKSNSRYSSLFPTFVDAGHLISPALNQSPLKRSKKSKCICKLKDVEAVNRERGRTILGVSWRLDVREHLQGQYDAASNMTDIDPVKTPFELPYADWRSRPETALAAVSRRLRIYVGAVTTPRAQHIAQPVAAQLNCLDLADDAVRVASFRPEVKVYHL